MDIKQIKNILLKAFIIYWALVLMIFFIAGDNFRHSPITSDSLSPSTAIGELVDGDEVVQHFDVEVDRLDSLDVYLATYGRENTGNLVFEISDEDGSVISTTTVDIAEVSDNAYHTVALTEPIEGMNGHRLTLTISSTGCEAGNAITMFLGNSVSTGRYDIAQNVEEEDLCTVNGERTAGSLVFKSTGVNNISFYKTYWIIVGGIFVVVGLYCLYALKRFKEGKHSFLNAFGIMVTKYNFLIKQLVSRDFKTKYKRSVLGVAWSFLNPLFTMLVQYLIFSTLFRSSIPNFPVYLLSGSVFYSFFNEAVTLGMPSIVGNASLIKKVYVPKYIYPLSRVISSLVNFGLAFAPLFIVMIVTRAHFSFALLLLIYDVACFLLFIMGMVLLLSSAMVFFQDVQFLWGVVSMLWMYMTPIFYPESIVPARLLPIYHLNPLYQFITFARTCILDGMSPQPMRYLGVLLPAVVVFAIGALVFKKNQDQFIMHL